MRFRSQVGTSTFPAVGTVGHAPVRLHHFYGAECIKDTGTVPYWCGRRLRWLLCVDRQVLLHALPT